MRDRQADLCDQLGAALTESLRAGRKPRIPAAGRLAWGLFVELHRARGVSMAGPQPIGFAEIDAYARLTGWPLNAHHVRQIRALDDAWLAHARAGAKPSPGPKQALSAKAFDAVF